MPAQLVGRMVVRDHLSEMIKDADDWILEHFFTVRTVGLVLLTLDYIKNLIEKVLKQRISI